MADAGPVRRGEGGVTVALSVRPRAKRSEIGDIVTEAGGEARLRVSVAAPPADGRANAAVIALLAKAWRVPKGAVTVVQGAASRRKTVRIDGDPATLEAAILGGSGTKGRKRDG